MKTKKVLIVATPRSGSSLITELCHEPPKSHIIFEPFHRRQLIKLGHNLNIPEIKNRKEHPVQFLNYLFEQHSSTNIVGAKTLVARAPSQELNSKALKKMLLCNDFNIIFIYRKNLFEAFISRFVASRTQQWFVTKNNNKPQLRKHFSININQAEFFMDRSAKIIKQCKQILSHRPKYIETSYEKIVDENNNLIVSEINVLRKFVGLPEHKSYNPDLQKQTTENIYKLVSNKKDAERRFGYLYGYLGQRTVPAIWDEPC